MPSSSLRWTERCSIVVDCEEGRRYPGTAPDVEPDLESRKPEAPAGYDRRGLRARKVLVAAQALSSKDPAGQARF
ncbi:protein of unknown function [Streptantibioticus cattleyicolor NRRL 8057 = DSM 46488]|nr:protein of unknown function [Streptantibioticus cattleyicolor NRRL 8057 = DSM 46488]